MAERRHVPLRVRFRSASEQTHWERESGQYPRRDDQSPSSSGISPASNPNAAILHHTRQVKELIHLGNVLRAELSLEEVLQQIVASMSASTGFRTSVINVINEETSTLSSIAFAGVSEENKHILRELHEPVEKLFRFMRPEFRISQSYFISHEHLEVFEGVATVVDKAVRDFGPDDWHPKDALLVPLLSPRKKKLLGFLSLDDPEDGKIPSQESIEVVELFANQAAMAIDHARLLQEREAEQRALQEGITSLREDLEQIQRGDLRVGVRFTHEKLEPVSEAINAMIAEMSNILGSVQKVTHAVDEHTHEVQHRSELLVRDANQQEQQVEHISLAINEIATIMSQLSASAGELSRVVLEAVDVTLDGQSAVDRAVDGMSQVREATLLCARIMKRLGESGQEINETILAMTDLTTRMNLVALNAAIEATRAGEYGQGFAVIVQELRTLAVHSSEAARKVAAHIRTIQRETSAISQSIEKNTLEAVKQTELVTQTGVALDAISVVTEQMAGLVQGISQAAENQTQSSQLVVTTVNHISQMTGEITKHIRQMQQSLTDLMELTSSLRVRLSVFRIAD